jgi:hypothetical protein
LRKRQLEHNLKGTRCYNCMHNCNEEITPLRPELAIPFDAKCWNKEQEIEKRVSAWKKTDFIL